MRDFHRLFNPPDPVFRESEPKWAVFDYIREPSRPKGRRHTLSKNKCQKGHLLTSVSSAAAGGDLLTGKKYRTARTG